MSRKSPFSNLSMRIMGEKSDHLNLARGRLVLITAFFMLCYLVVGARLIDATIIEGYLSQQPDAIGAQEEKKEESSINVKDDNFRADIIDRNGVLLATSLKTASLHADSKNILTPVETAKGLVKIFPDLTYGDTLKKIQSGKRFIWIKRNLTPREQSAVLNLGDPGLVFDYDYHRLYPQGKLVSHMVGYSDVDGNGLAGIERSFNGLLNESEDPLRLSIDVRLQHILRREVSRAITDFTAEAGAGVIMDVNSGQILAATSLPDFDPNKVTANPTAPEMFNRVTLGVYEPGSVFKIFTTAALLELKHPSFTKKYDAVNPIKEGRFTIKDYHPEKRPLTIPEIFMVSSNIGTAHMAQEVGTEPLKKMFADFGLMTKPSFEIEEVGAPIIPKPWGSINTLTASYGHGIAVSPLQISSAVSAVVNGGLQVKPSLVMRDKDDDESESSVRVLSKETSLKMRQLLRLVVSNGTARKADVAGYNIGGKTGTAQKNLHGRYVADKRMAAFVGAFPINDPKYVVFVMVDEPNPNKSSYGYATAGWVAAPAVGRIISGMGSILGMQPRHEDADISEPLKQFISDVKSEH
jgi:cell division protein FtsI (penicillin-binding protein 3)